jgi:CMP-N-acetylneuraminic acid synthetase
MSNNVCFLPCRKGSQRIPNKNIKPFGDYKYGLIELKLKQLLETKELDGIFLSTDDTEILDYAKSLSDQRILLHERDLSLCLSATSTDDLIPHVVSLIPDSNILWTHVTSPFVTSKIYSTILSRYAEALRDGYDSLMTTTAIRSFLWHANKPLNYDRSLEKWPRTQTLDIVHEVNSAAFIAHSSIYKNGGDRIGANPLLFELDKITSHDVDWPEDFILAELMLKNGIGLI